MIVSRIKNIVSYRNALIAQLIFSFIILLCIFQNIQASERLVKKGTFDLRNYKFLNEGVVELDGDWEFYPSKYYSPLQFSSGKLIPSAYVRVPDKWTDYSFNNTSMPAFGFATFRMKIIIDSIYKSGKQLFAIKMPEVFSAYKLWVDTSLMFQQGIPGRNVIEHKPKIVPVIIPFLVSHDTVTITIQVANYFSSVYQGLNSSILFGLNDDVLVQSRMKEFWYISGSVFCLTLGIYFFILFLLKQERKINLLFAITCFLLGIRYLIDNENVIMLFFPGINIFFEFKLLVLCLNIGPVILWTAYLFFPRKISKKVLQFTCVLFFLYSLFIIIAPVRAFGQVINITIIYVILILIYIIIASGIAYYRKRESAAIFFYGMIIAPIMFAYNMFAGKYYIPVGALLYLILQAFAITSKFANSHKRVIQLSEDLQLMNENLELLVVERTKELNIANESLRKLNFAKDRFISILSHDLRNPLNNLIGLSRRLFTNAEKNDSEKVIGYSKMINESATTCHALAENLLDWSLIQSGTTAVIPHKIILKETVDEVYELLKNEFLLKDIEFANCINNDCEAYADYRMTESILRNLITNSIKFTRKNGKIEVSAIHSGSFWQIRISDNGIGMGTDEVKNLFKIDKKVYNLGTNDEPGSGFGLILTKELVKSNGGSISVKSEKDKGTVVTFSLPDFNSASSKINID